MKHGRGSKAILQNSKVKLLMALKRPKEEKDTLPLDRGGLAYVHENFVTMAPCDGGSFPILVVNK